MYGRIKRRGRPPKTPNTDRPKFQVHLLKKPQYLKNLEPKGLSSPTTSRASSPQVNENTRRGSARKGGKRKSNPPTRGRGGTSRRKQSLETDYHYGSDFEDSTDHDDELGLSESETEAEKDDLLDEMSDDEISLSSFSTTSGTNKNKFSYISRMSPEPLWLQSEKDIQPLELPRSSDDLLIPREHIMQTLSIYEVLRHFKSLIRLSPFRFEDFCAVLNFEEQSNLLVEIHVAVLKAIFREEDTQQTHFGPLDQKDSANSVLYFIDAMTWPEALRSYIESDKYFDSEVLNILNSCEYPYTDIEKRLKVLQFMTDQILITSPVREDLIHEGGFQYDDHCRVCHRVGELLCCETCPAVFHLECVDPPLRDVPQEDWQCNLCKAHKVSGVTDCLPDVEKSGLLCRQEHLGFDRAGRKYWFLSRRIFVESDSGECLYYSTPTQFEELLSCLDPVEYEAPLCRELNDFKDEVVRQMELTEKLTNAVKGAKKTWFEVENALLLKERKEREELKQKLLEEQKEKERLEQEERERREKEEEEEKRKREEEEEEEAKRKKEEEEQGGGGEEKKDGEEEKKEGEEAAGEKKEESAKKTDEFSRCKKMGGDKKQRLTRSKTGSLTPRTFNMDDLRRRSDRILLNHAKTVSVSSGASAAEQTGGEDGAAGVMGSPAGSTRVTRYKANQIAHHGTFLFKLGMEGSFKNYVNQFSANPIALNKTQRNEERDKKRHMSHKFSLTPTGEFKWGGLVYGPRQVLVNTLRATLLQLESSIIPPFMHVNWPSLRKPWISAVNNSVKARDFARAMIVLQACIKPVVYASVWHEQLGHIRLYRLTALEREEKKRLEKKEKKDKEDEEEKNRMTNSWVKYTLGLKHQVWKQKGEEYRIHGQWGWQWLNATRNLKKLDCRTVGLRAGAVKYMVQVKDDYGLKILGVEPHIHRYFMRKNAVAEGEPILADEENDAQMKDILVKQPELQKLRIMPPVSAFEEIDISKALLAAGRIQYPKVARKSKLDEMLARRMHLKLVEERTLAQKAITNPTSRDLKTPDEISKEIATNRVLMTAIGRKIAIIKQQFTELSRYHQQYKCYSRECNSSRTATLSSCYSYECRKRSKLGRELVSLLSKADVIRKSMNSSSTNSNSNTSTSNTTTTTNSTSTVSSTQPQLSVDHKYTTLRNVLESKSGSTGTTASAGVGVSALPSPNKLPWQQTDAAATVTPSSGGNDLKPVVQDIKPASDATAAIKPSSCPDVKTEPTTPSPASTQHTASSDIKPEPTQPTSTSSSRSSVDKAMEVDSDTKEEELQATPLTEKSEPIASSSSEKDAIKSEGSPDETTKPASTPPCEDVKPTTLTRRRRSRNSAGGTVNTASDDDVDASSQTVMEVDAKPEASSSSEETVKPESSTTNTTSTPSLVKDEELTCDSTDSGSAGKKFSHLEVDILESSSQSGGDNSLSSNEGFSRTRDPEASKTSTTAATATTPATADVEIKEEPSETETKPPTDEIVDVENVSMEEETKDDIKTETTETKVKEEEEDRAVTSSSNKMEVDEKTEPTTLVVTKTTTVTTTTTSSETVKLVDGVVTKVETTKANCVSTTSSTAVKSGGRTSKSSSTVAVVDAERRTRGSGGSSSSRATTLTKVETVEEDDEDPEVVFSTKNTRKKIYLKRVVLPGVDKRRKRQQVKYPHCSTFHTRSKRRSLLVLPQHELRKLARHAGRLSVQGFVHQGKTNPVVWGYPCSRPAFNTCWLYRTINFKTVQAAALQLRILWACLRWDDMHAKPQNMDGKHQTTTDTEIVTTELLKQRHVGQFMEVTQYLMRKVVIPLELPKQVREVPNPLRSGLRKRKREETPVITEPQVTEEWIDESKLELWEIKQFGDRMERQASNLRLRSSNPQQPAITGNGGNSALKENKATAAAGANTQSGEEKEKSTPDRNRTLGEDTKEKDGATVKQYRQQILHQQLLLKKQTQQQQQGRQQTPPPSSKLIPISNMHHGGSAGAMPLNNKTNTSAVNSVSSSGPTVLHRINSSGGAGGGQSPAVIKIVQKTIPAGGGTPQQKQVTINKTSLSSLLSSNNTDSPRRIIMTKGSDGKPRIISASPQTPNKQPTLLPATNTPTSNSTLTPIQHHQQVSVQQPSMQQISVGVQQLQQIAPSPVKQDVTSTPGQQTPPQPQQRVQLHRGPGGKLIVKGLMPGQQIVQMPDGKLHVFNATPTPNNINNNTTPTKSTIPASGHQQQVMASPTASGTIVSQSPGGGGTLLPTTPQTPTATRFLTRVPTPGVIGTAGGVPIVRTISVANRQVTPITVKQVTTGGATRIGGGTPVKLTPHQSIVTTNKQGQTVVIRPQQLTKINNTAAAQQSGGGVNTQQVMIQGGNQVITSAGQVLLNSSGQQILTTSNQAVVSTNNLVQQIALQGGGKATIATINGQQVLIRTALPR
ncbi:hypothetical protein WDU94_005758 [Cyamophila willieti]